MKRTLLLLLLLPSLAMAEVQGITLVYKDVLPQTRQSPQAGQLIVGEEFVAVLPDETYNRPTLYRFDGTIERSPTTLSLNGLAFAGGHVYAADNQGLKVYEVGQWKQLETVSGNRAHETTRLLTAPDGSAVFTLHRGIPGGITYYLRDSKTGKLKFGKSFAEGEGSFARQREAYAKAGQVFTIPKDAVRVEGLQSPEDMKFSHDGKFAFVPCFASSSLVVLKGEEGEWNHLLTLSDYVRQTPTYGLMMCHAVGASPNGDVFVGGTRRLGWLHFDGKSLTGEKWWVAGKDALLKPDEVLPFVEEVTSLAIAKNGKHLFIASKNNAGVAVVQIGKKDVLLAGMVDDSAAGSQVLDVATSGDGKHLFVKTTKCQLLIYDLDATFTK